MPTTPTVPHTAMATMAPASNAVAAVIGRLIKKGGTHENRRGQAGLMSTWKAATEFDGRVQKTAPFGGLILLLNDWLVIVWEK